MRGLHVVLFAIFFTPLHHLSVALASQPEWIHLTWTGDPKTSVTITWRTDGVEPSMVEYGQDSYTMSASGPPGTIHHVHLTELSPSTRYRFRCGSAHGWSQDLSFTTAPARGDVPFTFVVLGDSRTDMVAWSRVAAAAADANAAFVIHTGDVVESGVYQAQWERWFESGASLLSKSVMMPTLGNHEGNSPLYFEYFSLPGEKEYYSFDYGNAHFICLNTEGYLTGRQLEWLERDLASSNSTWTFAYFHRPMFSVGSHGSSPDVQRAWEEVLARYHVDMVFCGHDHLYARTLPIYLGEISNSTDLGTIHIVSGGAGAPLHSIDRNYPWLVTAASRHHFATLTIDGPSLKMDVLGIDGDVLDQFSINKTPTPDLALANIGITPRLPKPSSDAMVEADLWNRGGVPTGSFQVKVELSGQEQLVVAGPLGAGERSVLRIPVVTESEGIFDLSVTVDCFGQVDEGLLEWNNVGRSLVRVSRPKADLLPLAVGVVDGRLAAGEEIILRVTAWNGGAAPSPAFNATVQLGMWVGSALFPPLDEGASASVILASAELVEGDWILSVLVDRDGTVDELDEENNLLEMGIPVRQMVKEGPLYYEAGAREGEWVLIVYDDVEGALPDGSQRCALSWGINGWSVARQRPPGTLAVGKWLETPMERGADNLWRVMIPTDPSVKWIDAKVRNGQLTGDTFDDNEGSSWRIVMQGYAKEMVAELEEAITSAAEVGLDVSSYVQALQRANLSLSSGNYTGTCQIIGNLTVQLKLADVLARLEAVESLYEEALGENLTIPRGKLLLKVARESAQNGNFELARSYIDKLQAAIESARAAVSEGTLSLLYAALYVFTRLQRRVR